MKTFTKKPRLLRPGTHQGRNRGDRQTVEQAGATVKLMEILRDRIKAYRETVSPAPPVVSWQRPVPPEQLQHSVIKHV